MKIDECKQFELGTPAFRITCSPNRKSKIEIRKSGIASLWFAQMRHLVDTAPDWLPAPSPHRTLPDGRTADQHQLAA